MKKLIITSLMGDFSGIAKELEKEMQNIDETVSMGQFDMLSQAYQAKFEECESGNACTNKFCNKDINNAFIAGAEFAKNENEIIEMAIANFENIEKMAERLTSGNVSHDGATIKGIAHRNVEYLRNYLSEQSTQGQQSTNSTI